MCLILKQHNYIDRSKAVCLVHCAANSGRIITILKHIVELSRPIGQTGCFLLYLYNEDV